MTERDIDEAIWTRLSEGEIRYTRGRRALVRALQIASGPQSAAEIHRRLRRSVPLSSLYRSLAVMEGAGVLAVHHGQGKIARYELAEWLTGHHHHLICLECGVVNDFELDERSETKLHQLARSASGEAGYELSGHALEVQGLCASCQ